MIPSIRQIGLAIEDLFVMEGWDNYGPHYDRTLMAWYQNFTDHWNELKANYSEAFYRMWEYYLLASAGSFRARKNQLWQIVFTKQGLIDKKATTTTAEIPAGD
jgi:cyclopropane-fatty-acyl-phospholipid synthase